MKAFSAASREEFIYVPLGSYTGTAAGEFLRAEGARGALAVIYVQTAGTGNLQPRISVREPFEANFSQLNLNATITTTGVYLVAVGPGVSVTPPGESARTAATRVVQTLGIALPDMFRFSVGKSDASAWVFGVSVRRCA